MEERAAVVVTAAMGAGRVKCTLPHFWWAVGEAVTNGRTPLPRIHPDSHDFALRNMLMVETYDNVSHFVMSLLNEAAP